MKSHVKLIKTIVFIIIFSFSFVTKAQDKEISNDATIDNKSYYQKMGEEDARFAQQFSSKNNEGEKKFWEEEKTYENELKRKDKKAYKAYMKSKKATYARHYEHCNHHCHHSDYYFQHAPFYYQEYRGYYSESYSGSSKSTMNTTIKLNTPGVRLRLF